MNRIHPVCEPSCTHRQVPDRGGVIITAPQTRDRDEAERLLAEQFPGKRIEFLGLTDSDDSHTQAWRIGARPWRPLPAQDRTEGRQAKREIKREHRPAVWEGTGEPVGPVDFSRPAEPEPEPYPAPVVLTGVTPSKPSADVLTLARLHGWHGTITHAQGHVPHATHGTPSKAAKKSEAVRLQRGDRRAVAVRMGGSWDSLWTWAPDQFFTRHRLLDDFLDAAFGASCGPVAIRMGWPALTDPIHGCAINDIRFVHCPSWGEIQGPVPACALGESIAAVDNPVDSPSELDQYPTGPNRASDG